MTLMEHPMIVEEIDTSQPAVLGKAKPDRPLPILCEESARERWGWLIIAGAVVALYGIMTLGFWAPADGGVDQKHPRDLAGEVRHQHIFQREYDVFIIRYRRDALPIPDNDMLRVAINAIQHVTE